MKVATGDPARICCEFPLSTMRPIGHSFERFLKSFEPLSRYFRHTSHVRRRGEEIAPPSRRLSNRVVEASGNHALRLFGFDRQMFESCCAVLAAPIAPEKAPSRMPLFSSNAIAPESAARAYGRSPVTSPLWPRLLDDLVNSPLRVDGLSLPGRSEFYFDGNDRQIEDLVSQFSRIRGGRVSPMIDSGSNHDVILRIAHRGEGVDLLVRAGRLEGAVGLSTEA